METENYTVLCPFGCGKILTVTKGQGRDLLNHPITECREEYKGVRS